MLGSVGFKGCCVIDIYPISLFVNTFIGLDIISGETSAGKSSFVNLLLGVELLPQSSLSCTSTICRIRNKEEKAISCIDQNDHEEILPIESDISLKEMKDILKKRVRVKQEEGDDSRKQKAGRDDAEYKYIDICWPIPLLDESIVIVDTPGVGPDNPELTKRLYQYLPKALAFIYVLNTPNAGGVQSDRILQIQKELERHGVRENVQLFDPHRAIFICNKWDQIHEEPEVVYTSVGNTLKRSWTKFESEKLFKLSTREEMDRSMKGQPISEEFNNILKGIEDMIPTSTLAKYRRHLNRQTEFIESFLLKELYTQIKMAQKSKEEKAELAEKYMKSIASVQELISTKKDVIIKSEVEEYCMKIASNLYHHLHNTDTIEEMFSWTDGELPNDGDFSVITQKIDELILDRINDEINKRMKGIESSQLEEFINDLFNKNCFTVLDQCESITQIIFGDDCDFFPMKEATAKQNAGIFSNYTFTSGEKAFFALTSPILVPATIVFGVVVGLVLLPFGTGVAITEQITHHKNVSKYKSDKVAFAKKRASFYLKEISVLSLHSRIMPLLQEKIDSVLEDFFGEIIPNRLRDGRNMVYKLQADLSAPREVREQCHSMETHILRINDRVIASHVELFKENMIMQEDITKMFNGEFQDIAEIRLNNRVCKSRVIRVAYNAFEPDIKTKYNGLAEFSRLGKLHHHNITTVYGLCPFEDKKRVGYDLFIEYCEQNLDTEVIEGGIRWSKSKGYIRNAIEGLSYLHDHGLVHKDIRLSTILISEGEAKLSYENFGIQCTPTGQIDGVPIIQSPEAIHSPASFEADIFQIGIVIWEAFYGTRAYYEGDKPIRETYEDLYLAIDQGTRPSLGKLNVNIRFLVQDCWHTDPDKRPSLAKIKHQLSLGSY